MDWDYEAGYSSFKEATSTAELLDITQRCSSITETIVQMLLKSYIKKFDKSQDIKQLYTFRKRITYLKKQEVFNDLLYSNLVALSEFRNAVMHNLVPGKSVFDKLEPVRTGIDSIDQLKNNSRKYQIVVSHCCHEIFELMMEISPEEIKHLELAPGSKFTPIKDPFSE